MKFIGDDREEEEELMTWIISMLKYAFVLMVPRLFFALILLSCFVPVLYSVTLFLPTSPNTAYSLSGIGRFDKIFAVSPRRRAGTAFVLGKYQISDAKYTWNNSYLNCGWRWKWLLIIAINFQFKQSFLSKFCGLDKSTIPPVYLQLSTTLYRLLSCCSQHFSCPRSRFLYSYTSSGGHAQRQRQ